MSLARTSVRGWGSGCSFLSLWHPAMFPGAGLGFLHSHPSSQLSPRPCHWPVIPRPLGCWISSVTRPGPWQGPVPRGLWEVEAQVATNVPASWSLPPGQTLPVAPRPPRPLPPGGPSALAMRHQEEAILQGGGPAHPRGLCRPLHTPCRAATDKGRGPVGWYPPQQAGPDLAWGSELPSHLPRRGQVGVRAGGPAGVLGDEESGLVSPGGGWAPSDLVTPGPVSWLSGWGRRSGNQMDRLTRVLFGLGSGCLTPQPSDGALR